MTRSLRHGLHATVTRLLTERDRERVAHVRRTEGGHGYDPLGMHPDWIGSALALVAPLYRYYFRVRSHDARHLPQNGPAILVANHAGTLPIDAALLYFDVFRHTDPPRVLRPVADLFVPELPFVGTFLSRVGVSNGTRGNVRHLLEAGELLLIFPEGVEAIGKPYTERYRLKPWHVGHAELALAHGIPVVPVAIVGSEEQWRQLGRIRGRLPFGIPYLPVPATPLPLPVRYDIHYGAPLDLRARFGADAARSPAAVEHAAELTRSTLQALIDAALQERRGAFW